jgi:hypothetical protein
MCNHSPTHCAFISPHRILLLYYNQYHAHISWNVSHCLGALMCQHGAHHFLPWAGRNSYNSIVCIVPHAPCFAPLSVTCISPVNWATGERIISHNLKDWTRRRNIAWECFCGLLIEYCTPVHFKTNCHGHAMAYCQQSPSICGFSCMYPPACVLDISWCFLQWILARHEQLPYTNQYIQMPLLKVHQSFL